ncbi:hypothetical protein SAMN06265360_10631 [Haloechinothrix alba]|uniref:Scaffolding protein n=1 Tax=Haloechinothrix alba TaxID=664784 RepID=A0A238WCY1_9PSEU|nr:hypothetical protein [Haloechinothrix alba]SNR44211.1 hypothetical protein SAMN06265360_10631 [Haloechinothrix alba]
MSVRRERISVDPSTILGYRADGRPIYPIAGGDGTGEGGSGEGGEGDPSAGNEPGGSGAASDPGGESGSGGEGDAGGSGGSGGNGAGGAPTEADLKKLRDEAASRRSQLREVEQERDQHKKVLEQLRQALDPNAKGDEDPAKVAERAQQERDQKDQELRELRVERAAEKSARTNGVDPDALTDSRSFARQAAKLDPSADSFTDDVDALVKQMAEDNPKLKVAQGAPASGSEFTGGSGGASNSKTPKSGDIGAWRKYLRGE